MLEGLKRHRELNGGAPLGWRPVLPIPKLVGRDESAAPADIYAVISTWHDADIIEATVRNCFAQGCSKVFILDNASPDDTVAVAEQAGATIARVYQTEKYDDDLRIFYQNEIIEEQTAKACIGDLWWFVLDADELPASRDGRPLSQVLAGLPREIRVIGTDGIELFPRGEHQYIPGQHPAACIADGIWRRGGIRRPGACWHWKHPIIRLFNGISDLAHNRGNHTVTIPPRRGDATVLDSATINAKRLTTHAVYEPDCGVGCLAFLWHAPFRREQDTKRRAAALCGTGRNSMDDHVTRNQGAVKRARALDYLYRGEFGDVELSHTQPFGRDIVGVATYQWRRLLPGFDEGLL